MNTKRAFPFEVNLASASADRMAITQCARYVRNRIAEVHAAEAYISCGEQLLGLKKKLVKSTPRGDNERIGWRQAFQLEPREFAFGRRHADKLIQIHEFFSGPAGATKNLPSCYKALYLLATKFKIEVVEQCLADGSLCPSSTETEVKMLAKQLHLVPTKKQKSERTIGKSKQEHDKRERVQKVWDLMAKLSLTIKDLTDV